MNIFFYISKLIFICFLTVIPNTADSACPDCSDSNVTINNYTYSSDSDCDCYAEKITFGPDITIKNGAKVGLYPETSVNMIQNVVIEPGATFNVKIWKPITQYSILSTCGTNGSISPSGTVEVNQGEDQSFDITPDNACAIEEVLVDNQSVGMVDSYTFNNVTSDHTIHASFVSVPAGTYDDFDSGTIDEMLWSWDQNRPEINTQALSFLVSDGQEKQLISNTAGYYSVEADCKIVYASGNGWVELAAQWFSQNGRQIAQIGFHTDDSIDDAVVKAEIIDADTNDRVWSREVPLSLINKILCSSGDCFHRLKIGYSNDSGRVEFWHDDNLFASYPIGEFTELQSTEFGKFWLQAGGGDAQYLVDNISVETSYTAQHPDTVEVYVDQSSNTSPYIGTETNPLRTIQEGIALVRVRTLGATVNIAPGTYNENVYVDKDRGWEDFSVLLVKGSSAGEVIIDGNGSGTGFFVKGIDEVNIDGLTIQNCHDGIEYTDDPGTGDIFNCTIQGNTGVGISLYAHSMHIQDTDVSNNGERGISIISATDSAEMYVYRCTIQNNGGSGIDCDIPTDGYLQLYDSLITGNNIYGGDSAAGVSIWNKARVVNNTIADNLNGDGLFVNANASDIVLVYNNIISGNGGTGFELGYGSLELDANNVWNNTTDYINAGDPYADGKINISEDPLFYGNYHLTQASPCVDSSQISLSMSSNFDFEGETRLQGSYIDIGADESPWRHLSDIYVSDSSGNDSTGDGTINNPFKTITFALENTYNSESFIVTVYVSAGTYFEKLTVGPYQDLKGGYDVTFSSRDEINRDSAGYATIIDGQENGSVVLLNSNDSSERELSGFVIQNGHSDYGGGIIGNGGLRRIHHNTIQDNVANTMGGGLYGCDGSISYNEITNCSGGGIYYCDGPISYNEITNCNGGGIFYCDGDISGNLIDGNGGGGVEASYSQTITNNQITNNGSFGISHCPGTISNNIINNNIGGVVFCDGDIVDNTIAYNSNGGLRMCNGLISRNLIEGNYYEDLTSSGGGLMGCNGTITNNTIINNRTEEYGGGICWCEGVVSSNLIDGNTAYSGGGVYGCYNLTNNTITNNIASYGGGVYLNNGELSFSGCTVSGNQATVIGGGIVHQIDSLDKTIPGVSGNTCPEQEPCISSETQIQDYMNVYNMNKVICEISDLL